MKTALDMAYEAYVVRKHAERQAHMLQLRQELIASIPSHSHSGQVVGPPKHTTTAVPRSHRA